MKKVVLHSCCGPCSSACVPRLKSQGVYPVMYFANSNIDSEEEFVRRLTEARKVAAAEGVELAVEPYDHGDWLEKVAKGFEKEPEKGKRCERCFRYNLGKAAAYAQVRGIDSFTTSLTVSPHKISEVVFAAGRDAGRESGCAFVEENFKKRDGFRHSLERSAELGLYRQTYCGCEFSKNAGKAVLVTGGTIRLGAAISEEFRRHGWRVITVSHRPDSGADVIADFRESSGPAKAFAAAIRLNGGKVPDALVNNAALFTGDEAEVMSVDFHAARKLTIMMAGREDGRGVVVNVLDAAALPGSEPPAGRDRAYTAAKRSLYDYTIRSAEMFADTLDVGFVAPACVLPPVSVHERAFTARTDPSAFAAEVYAAAVREV